LERQLHLGESDVLTLVMQSRLKVGDRLATRDAHDDDVPGVRIRDGKRVSLEARTRVRIINFEVLGWIDVEVLRGRRAGDRIRMRPSDLALLRVRTS
jgi:hypothetical protein